MHRDSGADQGFGVQGISKISERLPWNPSEEGLVGLVKFRPK